MNRSVLFALPLFAMLPAIPAAAQSAPAQAASTDPLVSLSVTEEVRSAPDIATIGSGVETRATSAQQAMADNAAAIDKVVSALLKAGIARKDIQTRGLNLSPQYDYSNQREGQGPRFIGYQASNQLSVTIRQLDKAGAIVDAMVNAGANNLSGPSFAIENDQPLVQKAREKAMQTAMTRADFYAKAAGYRAARLVSISETGDFPRPVPMPMMAKADAVSVSGSRIEPGELSASITLNFQYALVR